MSLKSRGLLIYSLMLLGIFSVQHTHAQFLWFKKKQKADTAQTALGKYEELIKSASVDSGVINVLKKEKDYYFEISSELFGRDFLIVNKLSQVPYPLNDAGVNKGMNFENLLVQFQYNKELNKVLVMNYKAITEAPKNAAIARSVANNYRKSILEVFDVEAISEDSSQFVVKVNKVYNGKEKSFNNVFGMTGIGGSPKSNFSYIESIKSFEKNITAKSVLTARIPGAETEASLTVEITSNLILLREKPMHGRLRDARVGYFSTPKLFFNDIQQGVKKSELITKWHLEPKDKEGYFKGQLSEPVEPIVFYIDPSTPEQWRKYIKLGVEDWNSAFERAGFMNAIQCKDASEEPDFDLDDVQYSSIAYAASEKANAMGPSVVDPRSGEIIEADIIWWHNVVTAVKSWMRVQTGIIDSASRANTYSTEQLGAAIRFICAHEVGHTFGLRHNMGSSFFYSTDSLRSASFCSKHATASSIMDYARFNYVAQPEDGVKHISPQIGSYDKFAIEWGYRYYGDLSPNEDKLHCDSLIAVATKNPHNIYLPQQDMRAAIDPRAQSEDLGNDAVKSSEYGIKNLKRVMGHILDWTTAEGEDYSEAGKLLNAVIGQWHRYSYHVLTNVGGVYINNTTRGDNKFTYEFVPTKIQEEAVDYLIDNVLVTPDWLFKSELYSYVYPIREGPNGLNEYGALYSLQGAQSYIYWDLLSNERMARMIEAESQLGNKKAYTISKMLHQLHAGIFRKTKRGVSLTVSERASQKGYIDALIIAADRSAASKEKKRLHEHEHGAFGHQFCIHDDEDHHLMSTLKFDGLTRVSDAVSLKRGELLKIEKLLKQKRKTGDWATQCHYEDLLLRIDQSLR